MIQNGASHIEFRPHPLMKNPHVQTLLGAFWQGRWSDYQADQHQVQLPDGDALVLHDDCPETWTRGDRVAILVHGLGGCHQSNYMVRISEKLKQIGVRCFRLDLRGCGAGKQLASQPFHAGCSDDAAAAVQYLADHCPDSPCTIVGFSMGGNIILKLAGESGAETPGNLDSAFAVAPPVDLALCCDNMSQGLNRLYDKNFVRSLIRHVKAREITHPDPDGVFFEKRPAKIREFDSCFTAPLAGFDSVEDYYTRASAGPLLKDIRIPTHILTAADDPIVPIEIFSQFDLSDSISMQTAQHGGHLGFMASSKVVADRRWMDLQVIQWIQKLGHTSQM
ncbi:MAG: YheT family hydrolase [Pirellulales bacterium]